ncbi:AraC family transcriptional regulator [Enterococcus sp. 669A]|uniref:AraC family transcriptional regulator n=1 Tax=Candidatus Enterococcus moelleringii TaxID=2815325 RepID=A0ABS3LBT5_9ENTE|nr:AraC family transcriptional regulator [Enterococcus sp. 669A]MBO1307097.1 AraC family transcriptional regulator [Enterococcus sp. 669A]
MLTKFCSSKVVLNKLITKICLADTEYVIPYWGALEHHYGTNTHDHYFYEVCLITDGEGVYVEEGQEYPLKKNSLILTIPEKKHQLKSQEGIALLYFSFIPKEHEKSLIAKINFAYPVIKLADQDPVVLTWLALLNVSVMYKEADEAYGESLKQLAQCVLQLILDQSLSNQKKDEVLIEITEQTELLKEIKKYIRDNKSKPLSVDDIAAHFFISKRQIFRLFKKYEPITCNNYIQQVKIEYAANLIRTTSMSITDIAECTGFSSPHYFSKVFTERMRDTPQNFRKLYSNAKVSEFRKEDTPKQND